MLIYNGEKSTGIEISLLIIDANLESDFSIHTSNGAKGAVIEPTRPMVEQMPITR